MIKKSSEESSGVEVPPGREEEKEEFEIKIEEIEANPNGGCTHSFNLTVKGAEDDPDLDYITKIIFHLHPSFGENVIEISKPPFTISRDAWGESDVTVEFHFKDPDYNQPQFIVHTIMV